MLKIIKIYNFTLRYIAEKMIRKLSKFTIFHNI